MANGYSCCPKSVEKKEKSQNAPDGMGFWPWFMQQGCSCVEKILLHVGRNQFVAFTVNVDDFNLVVVFQMLAQLCDVYIHGARVEVVVIDPDGFACLRW